MNSDDRSASRTGRLAVDVPSSRQKAAARSILTPAWLARCGWGVASFSLLAACAQEGSLAENDHDEPDADHAQPEDAVDDESDESAPDRAELDAGEATTLPGTPFEFTLTDRVYIDLSQPAVIEPSSSDSFVWDLLFEGFTVYTNSGAVGPGFGASFGPSSELDLLFDAAPAVPLRADVGDNAMLSWYWFGPEGVTSRFHTYGVRDTSGRLFKLQVLSYYDTSGTDPKAAVYTLRYAEVTPDGTGDTVELTGVDASAGGVTLPPSAPAGCVQLGSGKVLQLATTEWAQSSDWDLCFQRTEVFLNAGFSGSSSVGSGVQAVDLDVDPNASPDSLPPTEPVQTPESALPRFEELDYQALTQPDLPWDRQYETRARIGTRWLSGEIDNPSPTQGSWIIRGADGESHYALYFTSVEPAAENTRNVSVQIKPLAPPTITE